MLFLFFALEAILGDKSKGLKGRDFALRRSILGLRTTGGFSDPARACVFYEKVRSRRSAARLYP
jgi:hypothetical protein